MDTASNTMGTKPALTAIDVPNLIKWVKNSNKSKSALECMRFAFDPILQLTGGEMVQLDEHQPFLLVFGQNFDGNYVDTSNGSYSRQVRPIQIIDNDHGLFVVPYDQPTPLPEYRRRDLNVIPVVSKKGKSLKMSYVALSGVFTPPDIDNTPGAWTVPIEINSDGSSKMLDPTNPNTLAQAMNNYACANMGLYSENRAKMYTLLFGGISASLFSDGSNCNTDDNPQCNCCTAWVPAQGNIFTPCCNLPFSNDITTIEIDKQGVYRQYIMSEKYPIIDAYPPTCDGFPAPSTCSDPSVPLQVHYLFGANSAFIPKDGLPTYSNEVIAFDKLGKGSICVGYIVGGITSTILDTNCETDSQASQYVFKVTISPR